MITINRVPPEAMLAAQREAEGGRARGRAARRPEPVNVAVVAEMGASVLFAYRGEIYEAAPTPFEVGAKLTLLQVQLKSLRDRLDALERDALDLGEVADLVAAQLPICREAVALFAGLARPLAPSPLARLRRRLPGGAPNPFAGASPREVGDLLPFFSALQTRSSVQFLAGTGGP